jgi:GNAT superfamily N-acetyltransferase
MENVRCKRTSWDDPDFQALIARLDEELWKTYPELQGSYAAKNIVHGDASVVVCRDGERPVGCGCFRPTPEEGVVELKRMFVDGSCRGRGVGKGILAELEAWAAESGRRAMILETGIKQAAARAMYERSGYARIENYGEYRGNANSVCMRKEL